MSVAEICRSLEISIVPISKYHGPRCTSAIAALEKIAGRYGEDHLVMVLRVFAETSEANARALRSPALYAISDILAARTDLASKGLRLLEAFDRIDICAVMKEASRNRRVTKPRAAIAAMVAHQLDELLDPKVVSISKGGDVLKGEPAIARYLQAPLTDCKAWIKAGLIPTFIDIDGNICARRSQLDALLAASSDPEEALDKADAEREPAEAA